MEKVFIYCNGRVREVKCGKFFFKLFGFTIKDKNTVLKKLEKSGQKLQKYCNIYSKLCEVETNEKISD